MEYVGRFAPTPSGPLHLGSLVAALASFLDARAHGGRWLLRIDDIDRPRVRAGAERSIIEQLTNLGLEWDGTIRYQSQCIDEYRCALDRLRATKQWFHCDCTRRALRKLQTTGEPDDAEPNCVGDCRLRTVSEPAAIRLELGAHLPREFVDRWQGRIATPLQSLRDRIVLRRDGVYAYHLAVVVDDLASNVTDVVRGADLLHSTPAQMAVYHALGAHAPRYAHAPLVTENDGNKLAKSRHSVAIGDARHARRELVTALRLLGQYVPSDLEQVQTAEILSHAVRHWRPEEFANRRQVTAGPAQAATNVR